MKEIWMVNHYAVTPDYPSGTRHFDFAAELKEKGFAIKIFAANITAKLQETTLEKGARYKNKNIEGIDFYWLRAAKYKKNNWRRIWNMLTYTYNLVKVGKNSKSSPDLIIGSSPHLFAPLGAYFLAKNKGSKFFLEVRDLWPQFLVEISGASPYSPFIVLMRILEGFLYKRAEKIIILAPGSKDYLVEKGVNKDKIVFIPNGVHIGKFIANKSREEAREKFGFNNFTVVYTGAHGPANALYSVLDAAEQISDNKQIEFVLVGNGVRKKDLVEEAKKRKLDNIRFLDPIAKSEIPALLKAADVGLITLKNIPSFSFGVSPNKLFDYMGAGLPVISAVGGEISRLVEDNGAGIAVMPEKPEELAEAVNKLFNLENKERGKMGKMGRKLVEEKYSREKLVLKLLEAAG